MPAWSSGQDIQLKQLESTGSNPVEGATKRCCRCKIFKESEEFYWKNKNENLRSSTCKECQKLATASNYQKHRNRYIANSVVRKASELIKARELIDRARSVPCTDCKNSFLCVIMRFDHVRGVKEQNVSDTVRLGWSLGHIQAEIMK